MGTKTRPARPFQEPWHAVKVVGKAHSCRATEGLRGKRFLSDEAPRLPLPECSSPGRCGCIYMHYSDRRRDLRRDTDRGNFPRPWFGTNRRERQGRRADDQG